MIEKSEATKIAGLHLSEHPLEGSDYRWKMTEPEEWKDGWLFRYEYECTKNIPRALWEDIAGCYAFVVSKSDGHVRDVTWFEYCDR